VVGGCAAPGLDDEQAAANRRTCASLLERVANRRLAPLGLTVQLGDDDKVRPVSPRGLVEDPEGFYATLEHRLADAELGPVRRPTPLSPATRLIDACRHVDG
jgi:hypothetical protein